MKKLDLLMRNIELSSGEALGEALYELTRFVKVYESEPELESLSSKLPELVGLMEVDDQYEINGCVLSICRRVEIDNTTFELLVEKNNENPHRDFVAAMGCIDSSCWTGVVEGALTNALNNQETSFHAVEALYVHHYSISKEATINALAGVAMESDYLVASKAVATLCCLTMQFKGELALSVLQQIAENTGPRIRQSLAYDLGWASTRGLGLLKILAFDIEPSVRAAAAGALSRAHVNENEAQLLLDKLSEDVDESVRDAASSLQ